MVILEVRKSILKYHRARFLTSSPDIPYLPPDTGIEVAFVGRSNSGKSSVLNALTGQKSLAFTSKKPGCTQMINSFEVMSDRRLVDLPGYGYARVPQKTQELWRSALDKYFRSRKSLKGIVLLMDIRHPLSYLDKQMISWVKDSRFSKTILLTKADKLSSSRCRIQLNSVRQSLLTLDKSAQVELFSSLRKIGVDQLRIQIQAWLCGEAQGKDNCI